MERNVYIEPDERVVLRTKDVYQTTGEDDITQYSDTLLSIVADFKNSGEVEGYNAQSMVGKSKRGEVACRLFARIDPSTGIIETAGFKSRGCLAMTACASAACMLIEGRGIEDALNITVEDIRKMVDGVPSGKVNALHYATCAIHGLVGDFLVNEGAGLKELAEAVACDEDSISCIMAEHCSFRDSMLEARMVVDEKRRVRERAEALVLAYDLVRANTAKGRLTSSDDWKELVPESLTLGEFEDLLVEDLEDGSFDDSGATLSYEAIKAARDQIGGHINSSMKESKPSRFANRGVGIPTFFDKKNASSEDFSDTKVVEGDISKSVLDGIEHVYDYSHHDLEDDDVDESELENFGLRPPEGYKLIELDGELVLASDDSPKETPPVPVPDSNGIKYMRGVDSIYLYDSTHMMPSYAKWAFLGAEDSPIATFVYCVREESRLYPRPMARQTLKNVPIALTDEQIDDAYKAIQNDAVFDDIEKTIASNGDIYYYSTDYLSKDYADSLAELDAVERYFNV